MNWLTDFFQKHPEYKRLKNKRTRNSIHFELEPGLYEAHIWIDPHRIGI